MLSLLISYSNPQSSSIVISCKLNSMNNINLRHFLTFLFYILAFEAWPSTHTLKKNQNTPNTQPLNTFSQHNYRLSRLEPQIFMKQSISWPETKFNFQFDQQRGILVFCFTCTVSVWQKKDDTILNYLFTFGVLFLWFARWGLVTLL